MLIVSGLAAAIARVGTLVTFPIFAQYAGSSGLGAYTLANNLVSLVVPFASLGLSGVAVRYFAAGDWSRRSRSRAISLLRVIVTGSAATAAVIAAAAPWINDTFLRWPDGADLFRWSAALLVAWAVQLFLAELLRARHWLYDLSLLDLGSTTVLVGSVWLVLPAGGSVVDLLKVAVATKVIVVCITLGSFWRWRRPLGDSSPGPTVSTGTMIRFGLPLAVSAIGLWLMNLSDRLVIGHFLDAASLGVYGAVYTIALLLAGLNQPLNLSFYPRLMRATESAVEGSVAREVSKYHRYTTIMLVPATLFAMAATGPFLTRAGNNQFQASEALIAAIVLAVAIEQWNSPAQYILLCRDHVVFSQNAWLGFGAANLAANIVLVPALGLIGAACITLVTSVMLQVVIFAKAQRSTPLLSAYQFRTAGIALIASVLGLLASTPILSGTTVSGVWSFVGALAVFGMTYAVVMIALRQIRAEDLRLLARGLYLPLRDT